MKSIKKTLYLFMLAVMTSTATMTASAQSSSDYNKLDVFIGYSLASARSTTDSTTFTSTNVETFNNLCSSSTGQMIGTDLQHYFCDRRSLNGFEAAVAYNVSRHIGVVADVTGHFKSETFVDKFTPPGVTQSVTTNQRLYNVLGGVQVKNNAKDKRFKPFAHVLAGLARYTDHQTQTYDLFPSFNYDAVDRFTTLAMKLGGGLDIRAGQRVDIRLFQVDYNPLFAKDRSWEKRSGPFTISSAGQRADNITFGFGVVIH